MLSLLILAAMTGGEPQLGTEAPLASLTLTTGQKAWFGARARPFQPAFRIAPSVEAEARAGAAAVKDAATPAMRCTLRALKADPKLDPKIARPTEKDFDAKMVRPSGCATTEP